MGLSPRTGRDRHFSCCPGFRFCYRPDDLCRRGVDGLVMRKKNGIKYCGGCNPSYERVEMIQQVESSLKDRFIFSVNDQQDLDIMVFVCGCPRACANKNLNHPEVPSRLLVGER